MSASLYQANTSVDNQSIQPSSFDFVIPSGAPIGSIALLGYARSLTADDIVLPSGWTSVSGPSSTASNMTTRIVGKKLVSGDPGSTVTFASSPTAGARTAAAWTIVQGADLMSELVAGTPVAAANTTSTITAPTVTTTESDCFIVMFFFGRRNATTAITAAPTGAHTEDAESNTALATAPNFVLDITHANSNSGAPGSYGGLAVTTNAVMTHAHAYTIAVTSASAYKKEQFLPFF